MVPIADLNKPDWEFWISVAATTIRVAYSSTAGNAVSYHKMAEILTLLCKLSDFARYLNFNDQFIYLILSTSMAWVNLFAH